jgi:hypothetical protein
MDRPKAWDPETIDAAIPQLPETPTNGHHNSETASGPPVQLNGQQEKVWEGLDFKAKEDGAVDRSASLLMIGRVLFDANATRPTIATALRERDEALGWCKYADRDDGEQRYHEIVDELEKNGRGGAVTLQQDARPVGTPLPWPVMANEAFHGLPGEIVNTIKPHTEADPVAVLANLLTFFGNAAGRGACFRVGADKHHLNFYTALVGATSKGRKGMSEGHVRQLLRATDTLWVEDRIANGLSSGEGLIHEVRDALWGVDADGDAVLKDAGVADKRLLVSEPELARVLKVMSRDANTLSPVVRQGWDGGQLRVMTRTNPMKATDAHVSLIGHISKEELLRHLSETETASGFANRFLFLMVRRSKELPFGGDWAGVTIAPLLKRLSEALEFAQNVGEITWGASAKDAWRRVYGPLSEGKPGLFGAVVGRAEAQTVRLATVYAVMDLSKTIEYEHLEAALAFWGYAEESARYIFGDATGDPVADQVLDALRIAGNTGMTRTEIRDLFGRNKSADRIGSALTLLLQLSRVRHTRENTGGRPTERWFFE